MLYEVNFKVILLVDCEVVRINNTDVKCDMIWTVLKLAKMKAGN